MQVVINISKDDFEEICMQARMVEDTGSLFGRIRKAILHGVQLSKGHGRLVDADVIDNNIYDLTRSMDLNYGQISEVVDTAPTIIEKDDD
jgi:hypothetical protein